MAIGTIVKSGPILRSPRKETSSETQRKGNSRERPSQSTSNTEEEKRPEDSSLECLERDGFLAAWNPDLPETHERIPHVIHRRPTQLRSRCHSLQDISELPTHRARACAVEPHWLGGQNSIPPDRNGALSGACRVTVAALPVFPEVFGAATGTETQGGGVSKGPWIGIRP